MDTEFSEWGPFKPCVSEDMAKDLVKKIYGLDVTHIKRLDSFCDQNFFIQVSKNHSNPFIQEISEAGYTFKVINTIKSQMKEHFSSLPEVLKTVNLKGVKAPLPVVNIKNKTCTFKDVPLLNDERELLKSEQEVLGTCGIYMLTYVPGTTLASEDWTEDMVFDSGRLLAKLHTALQDHISTDLKSKVIVSGLDSMPFVKKILAMPGCLSEDMIRLSIRTLEEYERKIQPHLNSMPKGFIHGDFNDFNILVRNHDGTSVVDAIIDFEDVHFGHYVWDVCLMLAHLLIDSKSQHPMEDVGIALAGYLSLRSFSELEMSVIKACIQCRLCQTLVICAWSQQTNPSNVYIANFSLDVRQKFLQIVLDMSEDDLHAKLNSARQKCIAKRKFEKK